MVHWSWSKMGKRFEISQSPLFFPSPPPEFKGRGRKLTGRSFKANGTVGRQRSNESGGSFLPHPTPFQDGLVGNGTYFQERWRTKWERQRSAKAAAMRLTRREKTWSTGSLRIETERDWERNLGEKKKKEGDLEGVDQRVLLFKKNLSKKPRPTSQELFLAQGKIKRS